jgi:hypothetical protein
MSRADDSPLGQWSRRKAAARRGAVPEPEAAPQDVAPPAAPEPAPEPEKTDAELLEELGLPDPDTLGRGDDFSAFMARAVPARLRRRALRRLWGSDPKLAALDGLVDYDDDYRAMAAAGGVVKTSYEVGRGFAGAAKEAAERLAGEPAETPAESGRDDPEETAAPAPEATETDENTDADAPPDPPAIPEETPSPEARPRRMSFAFDDPPESEPDKASPAAARKSS